MNCLYFREASLDDLLKVVFEEFLNKDYPLIEATKGNSYEIFGVLLELTNPRARLSRSELKGTPYSCIGELAWYLSGSNKLSDISYYLPRYKESSDDGNFVHGGYGPRLLDMCGEHNQIENIVKLLKNRPSSRRAVIQLFKASDLTQDYKDIPCTTNIQFILRADRLDMMVNMRSNDVYFGLPHDVFCFTMIQELMACRLGAEVGVYKHAVGSLHLYADRINDAKCYVGEGWQRQLSMPKMGSNNIDVQTNNFIEKEQQIKNGTKYENIDFIAEPYWNDILILLEAFRIKNTKDAASLNGLKESLQNDIYKVYLDKFIDKIN